jgi:hypothetical protein
MEKKLWEKEFDEYAEHLDDEFFVLPNMKKWIKSEIKKAGNEGYATGFKMGRKSKGGGVPEYEADEAHSIACRLQQRLNQGGYTKEEFISNVNRLVGLTRKIKNGKLNS